MAGDILLVDDNEEFIDSIKDILEDEGFRIVTAHSGEEAVLKVETRKFDLILMDIKMPGMNGVESFLKMKQSDPDVRVVLFTAYALDDLIQTAQQHGVWAVLKKPLEMPQLFRTIDGARRREQGGCILVADDDLALCDNLYELLTDAGYGVALASNGLQAVEEVRQHAFDILLLDLKLPELDGLEVYRRIKTIQPRLVTILMTGFAEELNALIQQAIRESAYTLLTKPIDMDRLLPMVKEVIAARKSGIIKKPVAAEKDAHEKDDSDR